MVDSIDCHCGHPSYDHTGWREGTDDKRTNCRIIRCKCESYHTTSYSCYTNHHPTSELNKITTYHLIQGDWIQIGNYHVNIPKTGKWLVDGMSIAFLGE